MKALLHVHSTYSYDGTATLSELSAWGASRGLDFIFLTEHGNDFDPPKMERYVVEVDGFRNAPCRLVPGLELAVRGGFHVLGFNVRNWKRIVDPLEAVRFIRQQGGLAVLAHPVRYDGRWPDEPALVALNGIEVWNARYDGRFLPSGEVLDASIATASRVGGLSLFGGQDLHEISPHRLVVTEVGGNDGLGGFLHALAEGRATFGARGLRLAARPAPPAFWRGLLKYGHRSYRLARRLRDQWAGS